MYCKIAKLQLEFNMDSPNKQNKIKSQANLSDTFYLFIKKIYRMFCPSKSILKITQQR